MKEGNEATGNSKRVQLCGFALCVLLIALCRTSEAQQTGSKIPRIGYFASFGSFDASPARRQLAAFREGLKDVGYIEGKNIIIEYRHPKDTPEQIPEIAAELVRSKVDIIVTVDTSAIRAAKQATKAIPIVLITNQDPIAAGFVDNLARPGGNVTGITRLTRELSGKRLEVLREVVPSVSRVGVLWVRPTSLGTGNSFKNYQAAADAFRIQLVSLQVQRPEPNLEGAFQTALKERVNALVTVSNAVLSPHMKQIAELAVKNHLPSICEVSRNVEAGCLMSYAADDADSYRRAAVYVDKILKGAKPGDLPIEQPTKFELTLNLKTAKQVGVVFPQKILTRADRVIR